MRTLRFLNLSATIPQRGGAKTAPSGIKAQTVPTSAPLSPRD